ncbi:MAG: hypothetical protein HFH67_14385 [Lachnospiraceae bacterium]|nr:hypothetical protein [Lachnospiraceae bacterium]
MKRKYSLVPLFLCIAILFSSCVKKGTDKLPDTSFPSGSGISSSEETRTPPKDTATSGQDKVPPENNVTEESNVSEEKKETIKASIDTETGYTDENRQVNIIGFKHYKKLKSKLYKDTAAKNKEFIVLFLEINNKQNDKDYINANYLSARVDDNEIQNSVLFNEPEGFQTIFKNIETGGLLRGFIVWEVPEDWKKIDVVYNGWKDSNNLSLECTLTPGDYFDPPQYS